MARNPKGRVLVQVEWFRSDVEQGVLLRWTFEAVALCPPLVSEEHHLKQAFDALAEALHHVG